MKRLLVASLVLAIAGSIAVSPVRAGQDREGPVVKGEDVPAAPPTTYERNEPAVAVHPRNPDLVLTAAHDSNDGAKTIGMYRSTDGGTTFEQAAFAPLRFEGSASDPALGFDSSGTAYLSYIDYAWEPSVQSGVFVSRSTDAGETWDSPTAVATAAGTASGCTFHDKPYLAVDRNTISRFRDRLYVTWAPIRYRDADCFEFDRSSILLSYSKDGGRSFSTPKRVMPDGVKDVAMPYPAVDGAGRLHIAYTSFTAAPADCSTYGIELHMATSTDGGRTFRDRLVTTDCGVNKVANATLGLWRQNSGATIASDEGSGAVVLTWSAQTPGAQVVRVARLVQGNWKIATIRSVGNLQLPWPAFGPSGKLGLVYLHQLPSGIYDAYIVSSRDRGRTWSAPLRLTSSSSNGNTSGDTSTNQPFIGDYLGLAVGGDGVAHPVWTDVRTPFPLDVPNIWTRRVRL